MGWEEEYKNIRTCIYQFHMPLFFIISGWVTAIKYNSKVGGNSINQIHVSFVKNVKGLLVPYFLWSAIYIIIIIIGKLVIYNEFDILYIAERMYAILSFYGKAPLWFLGALFLSKISFEHFILKFEFKKKFILYLIIFLAIASLVCASLWESIIQDLRYLFKYPLITLFRFFPATFFVAVGYLLGTFEKALRKHALVVFIMCGCIFTGFSVFLPNPVNMHTFDFYSMPLFLASGITASLGIICFCALLPNSDFGLMSKFRLIGSASKDIMILHYPPIPTYMISRLIISWISFSTASVPITIVLFASCYFLHLVLQQIRKISIFRMI